MTFTLGSISHGTLRTEDLLPAFADTLRELCGDNAKHLALCDEADAIAESEDWDGDDAHYLVNETLPDALNEYAPNYCYFGAHEGDGADFGYWPSIDYLEECCRDGECLKVDDTGDVPADYCGDVMHVTDHGNVTLYAADNGKLTEVWSCV